MLLRRADLDAAVADALISRAQADALEDFALRRAGRPHGSDERFVIVNNFAEMFIAAGLMILVGAGITALRFAEGETARAAVALAAVAIFWLAGEFFVFRRRMMAPGIVASLSVAGFAAVATALVLHGQMSLTEPVVQAAGIGALGLALARFRIPFLVLPLAAALAAVAVNRVGGPALLVLAACGLACLAFAVSFDLRDPGRIRRASQFAFWLYVAGSPLTVHPLFWSVILGAGDRAGDRLGVTALTVAIAVVITLFGLVLDRRSPVISTLVYVAAAIATTLGRLGADSMLATIATLAVIGVYVIALGTAWRAVRAFVLRRLPLGRLLSRLPPVG